MGERFKPVREKKPYERGWNTSERCRFCGDFYDKVLPYVCGDCWESVIELMQEEPLAFDRARDGKGDESK